VTDLAARLDGYRRRLAYEWRQQLGRAAARQRRRVFDGWLASLTRNPPDVLVGANFAAFGGVRHHLQAIQRHSMLKVALAPDERVMRSVGAHHLQHTFSEAFTHFCAPGIRVVHSHVFPWFIHWCRQRQQDGMRWVHTYHLNYYPEHSRAQLEPWQQEINEALINVASHADVCLSVSKWQVEELRREHGIEAQYLPNGVDIVLCDAANGRRFHRKHGLDNFVLWVGRNEPVKNPLEFMQLAMWLPKQSFVMIGGGLSADALCQDRSVEIPANLHVIGSLPHREVLDAIAACSALVVTSKREGLPTLVMEAMAMCKPVVVPREAGCLEVIGQGEAGLTYEGGNLSDLSEQVELAPSDRRLGSGARARVLAEYDWRSIIRNLDSVYTDCQKA
jgi:glycosyltransferase involved in cell wall biosynthesis